jgi:hypothetical protein
MSVSPPLRVRRMQLQRAGRRSRPSIPTEHLESVFDLWVYPRRQPLWRGLRVSGLWLPGPRRLQRCEEHRASVLRRRENADDRGAPIDVRLNRRRLNVSGEYDLPASSGRRTGVHSKRLPSTKRAGPLPPSEVG